MALRFGGHCDPLDRRGRAECARLRLSFPGAVQISPETAAVETAALIGAVGPIDHRLAAIDLGAWTGLVPEQVDPGDLGSWLADPDRAPHGGESVTAFVARLQEWLDDCPETNHSVVVTSGTAQGLIAAALGCRFWSVEVAPAHVVNLSRRGGRWRARFGAADEPIRNGEPTT